jgi:hypothetical protein
MSLRFVSFSFALVVGLAACSTHTQGSCDQRQTSAMACIDYTGTADAIANYKSACTAPQVWTDSPCTHANSVGGCKQTTNDFTLVTWFYGSTPYTSATIMQACTSSNSTYVAP